MQKVISEVTRIAQQQLNKPTSNVVAALKAEETTFELYHETVNRGFGQLVFQLKDLIYGMSGRMEEASMLKILKERSKGGGKSIQLNGFVV